MNALDGNRDNMSYHLLDGSYKWVTKRLPILYDTPISPDAYPASDNNSSGKISDQSLDYFRKNITNIGMEIEIIRDKLDNMNGAIVKSIKDIATYVRDVNMYQEELKHVGMNMTRAYASGNEIIHETDEVIKKINILIDNI